MTDYTQFGDTTLEARARVAILRLNRPETMNAISARMMEGLNEAFAHIDAPDSGFRCAILTGAGRGFCSGANLTVTGPDDILGQEDMGAALRQSFYPAMRRIKNLRMPLLVAVNGPAVGFGFSLALMGDVVLAAKSAFFQLAFTRIGLVPDGGAAWLVARIAGQARARELIVLAERISADRALEWGLINRVHDDGDLMNAAIAMANELTERPSESLPLIRRAYWDSLDNTYEEQLELEARLQTVAGKTADFIEGVMAFREKRLPRFKGS